MPERKPKNESRPLLSSGSFIKRHIGPLGPSMLKSLKVSSLEELMKQSLPKEALHQDKLSLPLPVAEPELLKEAKAMAQKNKIFKSYIGMGYKASITPGVIQKNIWENPVWYSSYTPYQAELAQGRLNALLNFQTMAMDLTGMEIANSSLLDEGTALAEALAMAKNANNKTEAKKFFVDSGVFPQNQEVLKTRSEAWGWEMETGSYKNFKGGSDYFAVILQYPSATGSVEEIEAFIKNRALNHCLSITAVDLLSLTLLKPPGEMGADIAVGSSQNFGIPLFFGGPHAAFLATKKKFIRLIPGRIVGVSKDRHKNTAYRLTLQTREQHIRREKATSNICTSQALLATMASFYAVYHGPKGLKEIALKINSLTQKLYNIVQDFKGVQILNKSFFDTLSLGFSPKDLALKVYKAFQKEGINLRFVSPGRLSLTLDEATTEKDILKLGQIFQSLLKRDSVSPSASAHVLGEDLAQPSPASSVHALGEDLAQKSSASSVHALRGQTNSVPLGAKQSDFALSWPKSLLRQSSFLTHPVFNSYHTETELTRYIHRLQSKELSLTHSMIPLGSCTMKLNSVTELAPVSWPEFSNIHPFAPIGQTKGYEELIKELENGLCALTGFKAFSFQPNAGSQGEYAGLLAIKKYHRSKKESHRDICLIPSSAHGTNPASAVMAGFKVVSLACSKEGLMDQEDLDRQLEKYGKNLAGLMITYPSTYGFFEEGVDKINHKIHQAGGLVYLDGANMNALLGLCQPARLGFDVCHLNLHKTFCIPHGGGGPGIGPVGVSAKLKEFLPGHFCFKKKRGAVSSAPYGNAGLLPISWAYIKLMGGEGLKKSAQTAIMSANYIAEKLRPHYRILFANAKGRTAHECVIDLRKFKHSAGITAEDVAKRLIDYSFHAPTMSWPVAGTLMIEPTESENKKEIDRFCAALISIKEEIQQAEKDKSQAGLLKKAPHHLEDLMKDPWPFPYSKQKAFYPLPWLKERKFWPPVSRIENAFGDIHPFCSCPPILDE